MWILRLNDMRWAHVEDLATIARAETKEELRAFVDRERVPAYLDEGVNSYGPTKFHKCFRKGGPLEWYNDLSPIASDSFVNMGTEDEAVSRARAQYRDYVSNIPAVNTL